MAAAAAAAGQEEGSREYVAADGETMLAGLDAALLGGAPPDVTGRMRQRSKKERKRQKEEGGKRT